MRSRRTYVRSPLIRGIQHASILPAISPLVSILVLGAACLVAEAAPGDLDTSFAGSGKSRTAFGGGGQYCYAMALQVDGKRVLAGGGRDGLANFEFELVRFGTNNLLDNTFGAG